jgi:hypothetical protein
MILSTTFNKLKEYGACQSGYTKLAKHMGGIKKYGNNTPIDLITILESNGIEDCIWSLRAAIEPERDKIARLFAADCAESVLPLFESEKPNDPRPRAAIQAARDYAVGLITDEQRAAARDAAWAAAGAAAWDAAGDAARAAARDAARDAAWDAAGDAARAAAWAAARDAAGDAAWAAARDAAWAAAWAAARDAARDEQSKTLAAYLRGEK